MIMSRGSICLVSAALILLIVAIVSPHAVAQVVAFQADFNDDLLGFGPNSTPPGDPDEDEISITITGGSAVVVSSTATLTDKPLLIDRQANRFAIVQAILDPDLRQCGSYAIRWRSLVNPLGPTFSCSLISPNNAAVASVGLPGDGTIFMNTPALVLSVGYSPLQDQLFEFAVDMDAQTASLSIDGAPLVEATDIPFPDPGVDGLWFLQFSGSGSDAQQYALDDILVTGFECDQVPTRKESWASVKQRFR